MKKILFYIGVSLLTLTSCNERPTGQIQSGATRFTEVITLTSQGESHEFVMFHRSKYMNGISHWPGCKFCKNDSINN